MRKPFLLFSPFLAFSLLLLATPNLAAFSTPTLASTPASSSNLLLLDPASLALTASATYNQVTLTWTPPSFLDSSGALLPNAGFLLTATPGTHNLSLAPSISSHVFTNLPGNLTYTFTLTTTGLTTLIPPVDPTPPAPSPSPRSFTVTLRPAHTFPAPSPSPSPDPSPVASPDPHAHAFPEPSPALALTSFLTTSTDLVATATIYVPALPTSRVISHVTFYYQTHNLSCEETATSMALTHQGLHISQNQILARLGVDWTPVVLRYGRVVRWGDPDKAFVGNVNGSENNYTGQQANPKALVRVLKSYHAVIIAWSEPHVTSHVITASEIYHYVLLGHPVVAYATWDWKRHPIYYYTSEDGNRIPLISPYDDHVYTIVGVTPTKVLVYDPIRGKYWISKSAFQAGYEFGMAIVLK